jgi:hypothetical protein
LYKIILTKIKLKFRKYCEKIAYGLLTLQLATAIASVGLAVDSKKI